MEKPEQYPIDRDGPNIQKLVAAYGGYDRITPEAWAQFHAKMTQWKDWVRRGGLHGQV